MRKVRHRARVSDLPKITQLSTGPALQDLGPGSIPPTGSHPHSQANDLGGYSPLSAVVILSVSSFLAGRELGSCLANQKYFCDQMVNRNLEENLARKHPMVVTVYGSVMLPERTHPNKKC